MTTLRRLQDNAVCLAFFQELIEAIEGTLHLAFDFYVKFAVLIIFLEQKKKNTAQAAFQTLHQDWHIKIFWV